MSTERDKTMYARLISGGALACLVAVLAAPAWAQADKSVATSGLSNPNIEAVPVEEIGYGRRHYRRYGYPLAPYAYPPPYGYYVPPSAYAYAPAYRYYPPPPAYSYPPAYDPYAPPLANGDYGDYPAESGY
jgi:hypothetical protein